MTFRVLSKDEIEQLTPRLKELGWAIPHPQLATVVAAVEDDEIVGFCVQQLIPHLEPLWVNPKYRGDVDGKNLAYELVHASAAMLKSGGVGAYLSVASNRHAEILCDSLGMTPIPGVIYSKGI